MLAEATVKAHRLDLLMVLCTPSSTSIVPWMAYHRSSSLSRCTAAQPQAASHPETPFDEPSIALRSRRLSTFLSHSLDASESFRLPRRTASPSFAELQVLRESPLQHPVWKQ